jgi:hypothetical protein
MRVATAFIVVLFSVTACAQPPTRTGVEEVERARDVVEQLDDRNADLEDQSSD